MHRPSPVLVLVLTFVPRVATATTLVGIWTEKQITISADSRLTVKQNGVEVAPQTGCKIHQVRNLIFALAGLTKAEDVSVASEIENSRELHDQATNRPLPEDSIVVAAESAVRKVLVARKMTEDLRPDTSVGLIFGGMIDGKLQMFRVEMSGMIIRGDYSMPHSTGRIAYPESRGHDGTDPNRGIEVVGWKDSIERYKKVLPDWSQGDDVTVSRRLVAIEASDTQASRYVGAPVCTVVIDKDGVHWKDKGSCE